MNITYIRYKLCNDHLIYSQHMTENLIAKVSIVMNASPAKVQNALTNHELIKQYIFGSEVFTDWKEGSPIIYKGNYQGKTFEDKGDVVTV